MHEGSEATPRNFMNQKKMLLSYFMIKQVNMSSDPKI